VDLDSCGEENDNGLLIDEEFPSETFVSEHNLEEILETKEKTPKGASQKASILSQVNRRNTPFRYGSELESVGMEYDEEPKGMASSGFSNNAELLEDITKMHRSHIRDCSESGKIESKMLVNVTMKMGKNSIEPTDFAFSVDGYLRELDEILNNKIKSAIEIRRKIRSHFDP
jgi:hypothetical protein